MTYGMADDIAETDEASPPVSEAAARATPAPGIIGTTLALLTAIARREDLLLKLLALAITGPVVMVLFVKYLPDHALLITDVPRILTGYDVFWEEMQRVGTFRARFASYYLNYYVGKAIEALVGVPGDVRLHPLRLAAVVITTVSLWVTAAPVLLDRTGRWNWRLFYAGLMTMAVISLYLYLPFDFPALALISLGMVAVLRQQKVLAMVLLLACGLFRENNIHIAWFAVSTLAIPALSVGCRWAAAYVIAFFAEYWFLRKVVFTYEDNNITGVIRENLLSPGSWMIVGIILALACVALVVVATRSARSRRVDPLDAFFLIQFLMVPVWLAFYLLNGSNWSEFRIQLPTLLPLLYAFAYRPAGANPASDVAVPGTAPSPA